MKNSSKLLAILVILASLAVISSVARAGVPLGSDRFLIQNNGSVSEEKSAIAYNPDRQEYLVVWQAAEIWGRRISSGGALLGPAFRISPTSEGTSPDVAYSSATDEYLIVWETSLSVRGQRISDLGVLQGGAIDVATGSITATTSYDQPTVAYGSVADRYLVAYRYNLGTDGSTNIHARSYLSNGTPEAGDFELGLRSNATLPEQPDVAYNRSRNEFLVAWQQIYALAGDTDIRGRRVEMDGLAGAMGASPLWIRATVDNETAPAVAAIPTTADAGQYLIAWQSEQDIEAITMSGTESLGLLRILADTPWGEYRPAVAGSESNDQFLVTWTWVPVVTPPGMMEVQAKTLALDGTPLHDTTLVGGGQVFDSAVAAGPTGDYLVTFDDNDVFGSPSSDRGIYARLWGNRVYLPLVVRN
jgi:hypothetical protein